MDKQVMTTDFFEKQNVIYNSIALRRKELMGIAILSVILYHWFSWCKYGYLDMFHYLYIGVDVFLLLSGFGLCFSYNKCNLPRFYRRRLLRVFPLFVVFNLFLFLVSKDGFDLKEFISVCTTMEFYNLHSSSKEWYISAILLLYLLFPLFYRYTNNLSVTVLTLAIFPVTLFIPLDWRHDCLISRIPIFMYGILIYKIHKLEKLPYSPFVIIIFLSVGLMTFFLCQSSSLLTAMFCPVVLFFLSKLLGNTPSRALDYLGTHSLELFLSNGFIGYFICGPLKDLRPFLLVAIYWLLQMVFGILFIAIGKITNKYLT